MKIAIGVMGASQIPDSETAARAQLLGTLIARKGLVLITGATTGLPLEAAKGAKEAGGEVIGFSPAATLEEHHKMGLPFSYHDLVVCTGFGFHGRNLLNVRAGHGTLFVGGSMGALNEFTVAYDEERIIGILEGSGGFCDHMKEWMITLAKPDNRAVIHYRRDPAELVEAVHSSIKDRYLAGETELP